MQWWPDDQWGIIQKMKAYTYVCEANGFIAGKYINVFIFIQMYVVHRQIQIHKF